MFRIIFLITVALITSIMSVSCVAKNPVHDVVINEIQEAMQEEYGDDMAKVEKMTIFEATLKVYMTEDYPSDKLKEFARAITKTYGERMRANKILKPVYHVTLFQKKLIDEKKVLKPIAECQFENASDRIRVKDLGLGEGKYDAYR